MRPELEWAHSVPSQLTDFKSRLFAYPLKMAYGLAKLRTPLYNVANTNFDKLSD